MRETVADFARVISQYVDALAVRTFAHATVAELARACDGPDHQRPVRQCPPLSGDGRHDDDRQTLGRFEGVKLVFVGDGNNVARSLAVASALLGVEFVLACPEGYTFADEFREHFAETFPSVPLSIEHDPKAASPDADVVYTDVWASMGQEDEADDRRRIFEPYQVNEALLEAARPRRSSFIVSRRIAAKRFPKALWTALAAWSSSSGEPAAFPERTARVAPSGRARRVHGRQAARPQTQSSN